MRERITFVHGAEEAFDPEQLRLDNDTLQVKSLKAAQEDRLTFSFHELPQELWRVLKQCHELHIRWISSNPYPSVAPFVSKASPGLHVFFTPQRNRSSELLCPLLLKVFGDHMKCASPEETFTSIPMISERFASSTAFQYYQLLPSLTALVIYIQQKICPGLDTVCLTKAAMLSSADYLDVDYDMISQTLILSMFHHAPPNSGVWNERIENLEGSIKVEIGVLANENPTEPEELSLGGFLTILGEDSKPSPTLFSFPSRHHPLPHSSASTFFTTFPPPIGLHPTLRLNFSTHFLPPSPSCALHTYLTLPSALFPDKYQLSNPLLLTSKNLHSIRFLSGETDLEAPDWVIQKWGSAMLVQLAPPAPAFNTIQRHPTSEKEKRHVPWHADIPLHLRYLPPILGGISNISVPWPVVFWACTAEEGTKMSTNPFDRTHLGYENLFGPRTMFYHLQPKPVGTVSVERVGALVEKIQVPVLDLGRSGWIEAGTVGVVVLGVLWVGFALGTVLFKDYWGMWNREGSAERRRKNV